MEISSITEIWRLLSWLPKFILRKVFSPARMADLVRIDVQPRHRAVDINLSEKSTFEIYFEVINMSPFEVTLKGAEVEFIVNGVCLSAQHILEKSYPAGSISQWFVKGVIQSSDADYIAKYGDRDRARVGIEADLSCILHDFKKGPFSLEGVNCGFTNLSWRKGKLEQNT